MYILLTYDVDTTTQEGRKRLRKVAKCCVNHGQRVQNSVFECSLNEVDLVLLLKELKEIINPSTDSIRIYKMGRNYSSKISHIGKETAFDIEGMLLI